MKKLLLPVLGLVLLCTAVALAQTGATRFNGIQISSQATATVSAGAAGWWWDGSPSGPLWRKTDGTDLRLGTIAGTITTPKIPYATSATALGNSGLSWDNTNKILTFTTQLQGGANNSKALFISDGTHGVNIRIGDNAGNGAAGIGSYTTDDFMLYTDNNTTSNNATLRRVDGYFILSSTAYFQGLGIDTNVGSGSGVFHVGNGRLGQVLITSAAADGASALALNVNTTNAWSNATAKLISLNTNSVEKFAVTAAGGVSIAAGGGIDSNAAGTFAVCGTNCTTLALAHAGVAVTGSPTTYAMTPSSTLTLTAGATSTWDTVDGTVKGATFDRTTAGTLNIGGTATAVAFSNNVSSISMGGGTLSFSNTAGNKTFNVVNAPTDTVGSQLAISSGGAGAASAANGKAGGVINITTASGGAGSGSFTGGPSGAFALGTGNGAAGTATAAAGASASVTIQTGAGGTNNGGGGAVSGNLNLNIGAASGAAAQGKVTFQNNGTTELAYFPALHALVSNTAFVSFLGSVGGEFSAVYSRHYHSGGTAPTIAVGSAAQLGTSPAAAVTTGTDASGTVTFTSGTGPSAFVANTAVIIGTITFNATYTSAPRGITVTPAGSTAAALSTGATGIAFFAEQSSAAATTFIIKAVSVGTPTLAASTAYPVAYMVIQ